MSKRPSIQWYTLDWRNNIKLRRCSWAGRGVWSDLLCIFNDSDEHGVVRWPLAELAHVAGAPLELLHELRANGVLKGSDDGAVTYTYTPRHAGQDLPAVTLIAPQPGPCWYSSRMVEDEWRRKTKGAKTRFTAENHPQPSPSQRQGDLSGDGSTTSSSSSSLVAAASSVTTNGSANGKVVVPEADKEELASQLQRVARLLNLDHGNFTAYAADLRTLLDLKREGCDFDAHILPAAEKTAQRGSGVRRLAYVAPAARELRDAQSTVTALPIAFEDTDERGWKDRLKIFRKDGRWLAKWGGKPGEPDCRVLASILEARGAA